MTLILKLDLDMVKMYDHTENQVSMPTHSKATAQTDRQTDTHRHDKNITVYAGSNKNRIIDVKFPIRLVCH